MDLPRSSPMLDQYRRIKKEQEGNILFFRLGDFYEMFAQDAVEVSSLLNLTLTSRNGLPMCGIPYHAAKSYIARLLKFGKKIAVCEQLSKPEGGQKIVERSVVEVITPGTTVDEDFLDKGSSNYLSCLAFTQNKFSFSYIDLSTGEFFTTCFAHDKIEILRQELERLSIKEMLIQESLLEENKEVAAAIYDRSSLVLNRWADWLFDPAASKTRLEKQFGLANLKSFGLDSDSACVISAGALLDYLDTTSRSVLSHLRTIKVYNDSEYLGIDESSQRNLELLCNQRDGDTRFSLLEVLDETRCSMGRRLLKRRTLHPLCDLKKIQARLDMVESLYRGQGILSGLRELLGKTPDLERLCSRLAMDKAHGRDLLAIKNAIVCFFQIGELFFEPMNFESESKEDARTSADDINLLPSDSQREFIKEKNENEDTKNLGLTVLRDLLERGICDEPSTVLNEGNLIKEGFNPQLDQLKALRDNSRQILEDYVGQERQKSGILGLKIKYNRLIGYYFEVTKSNLSKVPDYFIRRQGVVGGERYTTDRLASLESEINGASEKVIELEKKLFLEIRESSKQFLVSLAAAGKRLAELDVSQSLAKAASIRGWVRPLLDESGSLEIYEGRHPVVEAHLNRGEYIPNDILLDIKDGISFAMITGPNMAGKSTYLRSAALIVIMAQMGSFVPAREARLGLCDRIYCRVGASDNLARGESTFLVEMNETAFILNTATDKSLVIMDEVGRGTGTNDGLSIAWAVSEELLSRIGCRTLFATHFHELSFLSHPKIANRSMEVLDTDGKIVFLRKLKEGPASESYGIHVARLAGIGELVLKRAQEIMELLKSRDNDLEFHLEDRLSTVSCDMNKVSENSNLIEKMLGEVDLEQITPLEALNLLCEWKRLIVLQTTYEQITAKLHGENNAHNEEGSKKKSKTAQKPQDSTLSLFD